MADEINKKGIAGGIASAGTNPGLPLVKTERFLDSPERSRNQQLASFCATCNASR